VLLGIEPPVWREIEVSESYSFWDLHVAVQDAMGWMDCHLHLFSIKPKHKSKPIQIGIPDEEFGEDILPGWETPIKRGFTEPGELAKYEYDFGDGWLHNVVLMGILLADGEAKYPHCLAGERACPPEDCGGIPGYHNLLETLRNPDSEEHDDMVEWLKNHHRNYHPFDPDKFDPKAIKFTNPKERLKNAFGG